ncbi:helix-turn-helix domain-containing protein [Salinarimonas rosea]|uniref:helix-turn-helix domain-containing protein n=1 Tax=Salinarimonas rosea TaxID=552063 RepID=UPI0012EC9832|nr:hypothetical protein [Salinarimonas rosea]
MTIVLRPMRGFDEIKRVSAAMMLAKRGVSLLGAKRAVERLLEHGETVLRVPTVERAAALAEDLEDAGCRMTIVPLPEPIDVRSLRAGLGMTREQFALRYGLDPEAVRNWERTSGGRAPDLAATRYLQAIARDPDLVGTLIEREPRD